MERESLCNAHVRVTISDMYIDRVDRVADVPQEFASLPSNVQQDRTDFLDIDLAWNFPSLFYGLFLYSVIELV